MLLAGSVTLGEGSYPGRSTLGIARRAQGGQLGMRAAAWPLRARPAGAAVGSLELGERIAVLRERGLSLQAIADTLNADGVPTQRGGALAPLEPRYGRERANLSVDGG